MHLTVMHRWSQGARGAGRALQLECPEKGVQEVAAPANGAALGPRLHLEPALRGWLACELGV